MEGLGGDRGEIVTYLFSADFFWGNLSDSKRIGSCFHESVRLEVYISHLFRRQSLHFFHGSVLEENHTFHPKKTPVSTTVFLSPRKKGYTLVKQTWYWKIPPIFCRKKTHIFNPAPFLSVLCLFTIAPPENKQKPPKKAPLPKVPRLVFQS